MNCVCGHSDIDHHAHTGHCHDCTCSYFEEDLGGFGCPAGATNYGNAHNKYTGQYVGPYTLDQETA